DCSSTETHAEAPDGEETVVARRDGSIASAHPRAGRLHVGRPASDRGVAPTLRAAPPAAQGLSLPGRDVDAHVLPESRGAEGRTQATARVGARKGRAPCALRS